MYLCHTHLFCSWIVWEGYLHVMYIMISTILVISLCFKHHSPTCMKVKYLMSHSCQWIVQPEGKKWIRNVISYSKFLSLSSAASPNQLPMGELWWASHSRHLPDLWLLGEDLWSLWNVWRRQGERSDPAQWRTGLYYSSQGCNESLKFWVESSHLVSF